MTKPQFERLLGFLSLSLTPDELKVCLFLVILITNCDMVQYDANSVCFSNMILIEAWLPVYVVGGAEV